MLIYDLKRRNCGLVGEYVYGRFHNWGCFKCKKIFNLRGGIMMHEHIKDSICFKEDHELVDYGREQMENKKRNEKYLTCPRCGKKAVEMTLRKGEKYD